MPVVAYYFRVDNCIGLSTLPPLAPPSPSPILNHFPHLLESLSPHNATGLAWLKNTTMRLLLILSAVLLAAIARAQNVGIGKSNPTEKLDVSGNVNIDGRLKLNGSAGQPGQTLMYNRMAVSSGSVH